MDKKSELLERFLRYAAISTQSDPKAAAVPSNPKELELARLLAGELQALGLEDVEVSEHAVVTGRLASSLPAGSQAPVVGWCIHMDTVDCGLSPDVHPHVVKGYAGGDLCLNPEKDLWIRVAEHPELERCKGDDLVVTDGTSVLGADDKSAIANVMTALDIIVREKRPHGEIRICFVPDEEIGLRGAKKLDLAKFPVDFAYTIDCCELGEVVWETFNAGSAELRIKGVSAHPMASKGVLVNPVMVAHDFLNLLDRGEMPEFTAGREGFILPKYIEGGPSSAVVKLNIRDHSQKGYEAKKRLPIWKHQVFADGSDEWVNCP